MTPDDTGGTHLHATLRDGSRVVIRDVTPADAPALMAGFDHLSRQSRLFRFLQFQKNLPADEARRLTTPDRLHDAVGALLLDGGPARPAGIGHAFRARVGDSRAELALTVTDAAQGRGLGALILGVLVARARRRAVHTLDAVLHPRNAAMRALLAGAGAEERIEDGLRIMSLPIRDDPADYPGTATGDGLRRAAWLLAANAPRRDR